MGEALICRRGGGSAMPSSADYTPIQNANVTLKQSAFTYDGSAHTVAVDSISMNGKPLTLKQDYLVDDKTTTKTAVGSYNLGLLGLRKYYGEALIPWTIDKAPREIQLVSEKTELEIFAEKGWKAKETLSYPGGGTVSAQSLQPDIALASVEDNILTVEAVSTGQTTVTVTLDADACYLGAQLSIPVSVNCQPFTFDYTGEYTTQDITLDNQPHYLYTMTSSGTLNVTCKGTKYIRMWMCGGGGSGCIGTPARSKNGQSVRTTAGNGGGGGGCAEGKISTNQVYTVTIGAGGKRIEENEYETDLTHMGNDGGFSQIAGDIVIKADGGKWKGTGGTASLVTSSDWVAYTGYSGSGGGGSRTNNYGTGTGTGSSTYPFNISSLKAHSAGGGGGVYALEKDTSNPNLVGVNSYGYAGGTGGTGGKSGAAYETSYDSMYNITQSKCRGGEYGGGQGGTCNTHYSYIINGYPGHFYGAAGGGGPYETTGDNADIAGNGYQGVMYVAVPKNLEDA